MPRQRITVMCVDDHRLVREGVATLVNHEPDMEVIASAGTGEEAVLLFHERRPDITLMDLQLSAMSGLEAIRAIRQDEPNARIIVLTVYQGEEDIFRAMQEGAATYLLKDSLTDDLAGCIRAVHEGKPPLSDGIRARLEERKGHKPLSAREL
jgi:DNA-binding NarL/FixJ family response regulator